MPKKFLLLVLRNIFRSKTRAMVTIIGCITGAFIISFFVTAEHSLGRMLHNVGSESNLIITQRDRF